MHNPIRPHPYNSLVHNYQGEYLHIHIAYELDELCYWKRNLYQLFNVLDEHRLLNREKNQFEYAELQLEVVQKLLNNSQAIIRTLFGTIYVNSIDIIIKILPHNDFVFSGWLIWNAVENIRCFFIEYNGFSGQIFAVYFDCSVKLFAF